MLGTSAGAAAQDVAAPPVIDPPVVDSTEVQGPNRPALLIPMYLANAALHGLDAYSTSEALKAGHREANPLLRNANLATMIGVKAAATITSVFVAEKLWRRNRTAAVAVMVGVNVGLAAVVANNYRITRVNQSLIAAHPGLYSVPMPIARLIDFINPRSLRMSSSCSSSASASEMVRHGPHAQPLGARGHVVQVAVPDQDHFGLRLHRDVETVLRAIVDKRVEVQRVGDLAARALHDEDARILEPVRFEPPLRLQLHQLAGGGRPRRQENDFPPPIARGLRDAGDDARLQLRQRGPEVVDLLDVIPQLRSAAGR